MFTPVKPEPSPTNEPVYDPVASTPVNVKPSIVVAVAPNDTAVLPSVKLSFANLAFAIPSSAIVAVMVCAEADNSIPSVPIKDNV